MPKIISELCELVKLCHINRSGPVFFRHSVVGFYFDAVDSVISSRSACTHIGTELDSAAGVASGATSSASCSPSEITLACIGAYR